MDECKNIFTFKLESFAFSVICAFVILSPLNVYVMRIWASVMLLTEKCLSVFNINECSNN